MPKNRDDELDREIRSHLEIEAEERLADGLSEVDARDAARRAFGNVVATKEETRVIWAHIWLEQVAQDLRQAVRMLAKNPGFASIAILTLALGIAANTAIFSVVNAVLLKPLKTPNAATLVRSVTISSGRPLAISEARSYNVWREYPAVFDDVSAHWLEFVNVTGGAQPEQVPVARVTAAFFRLFRAPLLHGRTFTAEEDRPNGGAVVVLSHGFWTRRYGSDQHIVGQTISLGNVPHVVVGILAPTFDTEQFDQRPDIWLPFQLQPDRFDGGSIFQVTARLREGITAEIANAQLRIAFEADRERHPDLDRDASWVAQPLHDAMVSGVRMPLTLLLAAVGVVLLVACVNVAGLLIVRADARQREMAVRNAIGAGRGRIIRQLVTESLMLSSIAGALGLVGGAIGIKLLLAAYPGNNPFILGATATAIPRIGDGGAGIAVDWRVVGFAVVLSVVTGLVFGVVPALRPARASLSTTLRQSTDVGPSAGRRRARAIVVAGQIALALMLLIGAGLLIRTAAALRAVEPGFKSDRVLTMRMSVTGTRFETRAGITALTQEGTERLRSLPGVVAASTACCMPLETVWHLNFVIASRPASELTRQGRLAFHGFGPWTFVSPGYFDVFKIPILRGRDFTQHDTPGAPGVVIINEAMARRFWPTGDPLKDQLIIGRGMRPEYDQDPIRQIVGIVQDVRDTGLDQPPRPAMYVPVAQIPDKVMAVNVRLLPLVWIARTTGNPYALAAPIRAELERVSVGLPVAQVRSMDDVVAESTALRRFEMWLMTVFGACALVLAGVGVYGLMAYSVRRRTREIGLRLALGAEAHQVRDSIIRSGLRIALTGVAAGLIAAFWLSRAMESLLFGVTPRDPMTFATVSGLFVVVALLASYVPARRAMKVDPVVALRSE